MPSATTSAAALHLLLLLLLLFLLSFALRPLSSTTALHPRRILHQPLLPQDSNPPPAPSPPNYPFSTSAPNKSPFFQSYPSPPPPPSPASFATFPANISSLTVPGPSPSKAKSSSSKLIIAAASAVVAAITVASLAVFLHLRHRRSTSFNQSKSQANQAPNSHHIPKLHRPSQSSSEFLYLGTLVNSHVPGGGAAAADTINYSNAENSRKFDSPELRPLPPLITQRREIGNNAEVISSRDDESEKFYSPKGSINDRESSVGTGSASRRTFAAVEVENFNGSISNSSSTYSVSSPAHCASFRLPPANNRRSMESMPKPPDLIEIQTVAPLPPQMSPPPEARVTLLHQSASPSPPSSSSPERNSRSEESSPRNSDVLDQSLESPALINNPLDNTAPNPAPPESRSLELPARGSSSLESSTINDNASDREVESTARSSTAIELNSRNSNDIPTSPELRSSELLRHPSPLPLNSSPTISNVSDKNLEFPVSDNSALEHTIPTPPEIQGVVLPESASPFPVISSPPRRCLSSVELSPRNSSVSDQLAESPSRNSSTGVPPPPEIPSFVPPESDVLHWKNVESPARSNSYAQQNTIGIPTETKIQPESTSPISPGSREEISPRNSDVSDHSVEYSETPTVPEMESVSPLAMSSGESSPRNSDVSDQNVESPARINSQVPASPEVEALALEKYSAKNEDTSPRNSNASDQDDESSMSSPVQNFTVVWYYQTPPEMQDLGLSSPERHSVRYDESLARILNVSDQNVASPARVSSPERSEQPSPSSPERLCRESEESSSKTLHDFDQNMEPPSSNAIAIPTPPPPPPPLPKACLSPRTPTPAAKTPVEPPALINPLRPIGFDSPTLISPMQLPSEDSQADKETDYSAEDALNGGSSSPPKPKLKPLHWDKVRASSDREMVWDQLKCSSFKLNEEMIETLFLVHTPTPNPNEATRWQVLPPPGLDKGDTVLDPKKAQNIAILLKALHVTVDEVCEGLLEGNADMLGSELLESLMKMAPTKEEERKLKGCRDDSDSSTKLGPAERFLKAVVDVPHAFKRVEALLYVSNFESEIDYLKKSFSTLEAACEELRASRLFLKLLEAVLMSGNRMNVGTNRGDAYAFKLDTLLKLVDVKGADGKTTLLHFVVQEMIRSEGARLSDENDDARCRKLGLRVVSGLSSELSNVKKAAAMDAEVLSADVSKLARGIKNVKEIAELNESARNRRFAECMIGFTKNAEEEIFRIQAEERLALSLVKEITEYFHGDSAMEEPHPFRIFTVVRDFLAVLDRVCKDVQMINDRTMVSSAHKFPVPVNPMLLQGGSIQTSSDGER